MDVVCAIWMLPMMPRTPPLSISESFSHDQDFYLRARLLSENTLSHYISKLALQMGATTAERELCYKPSQQKNDLRSITRCFKAIHFLELPGQKWVETQNSDMKTLQDYPNLAQPYKTAQTLARV